MPVASSIEADAADGNLDKWKGRIIIVDYTRYATDSFLQMHNVTCTGNRLQIHDIAIACSNSIKSRPPGGFLHHYPTQLLIFYLYLSLIFFRYTDGAHPLIRTKTLE